ncbi:extensin [Iris pallida]|uniref:Extensin n=1 Tax=Iris pallida TaxID=29817 RepID=A0AAX6H662_IRIPA|nr:extensin [Iris pallida]
MPAPCFSPPPRPIASGAPPPQLRGQVIAFSRTATAMPT